jgi:flagellar biosynthetic protein FliQ
MLSEIIFFDTLRQGLWVALVISLPILTVALLAGVSIGLIQALTSIQEMTLTFVPKLAAIAVVFWISMGFMTQTLVAFFHEAILPLIAEGSHG